MALLHEIPIEAIEQDSDCISPQLMALVQEILAHLRVLIATGKSHSIDLRSLPLMPGDLERLKLILGKGEVKATVNALGPSDMFESQIPGVWWIIHKNYHNEVIAEYIEVTTLPEMLKTQHEDLKLSSDILESRVEELNKL